MINFIKQITAKQLFILGVLYTLIAVPLGFYLANSATAFLSLFCLVGLLWQLYDYQREITRQDNKFVFFYLPVIFVIHLVMSGYFDRAEFITQKEQLQQTSGIIPQEATIIKKSSRRASDQRYLTINNINFNCLENKIDACYGVYDFAGQNATLYYQSGAKNGNLVYEINIDDKTIYQFDRQLAIFSKIREKENQEIFWAFVIYVLPSLLLYMISRYVVAGITIASQEQINAIDDRSAKKHQKIRKSHYKKQGIFGTILKTIMIAISVCLLFMVWVFWSQDLLKQAGMAFIGFVLCATATYMLSKSYAPNPRELQDIEQFLDDL